MGGSQTGLVVCWLYSLHCTARVARIKSSCLSFTVLTHCLCCHIGALHTSSTNTLTAVRGTFTQPNALLHFHSLPFRPIPFQFIATLSNHYAAFPILATHHAATRIRRLSTNRELSLLHLAAS